jgi:Glycosyltransferase Family 4
MLCANPDFEWFKVKIALAHKRLDLRGGTERVFYRTAVGLRDRGHEVHLFCQKFSITPPTVVVAHRVPGLTRPRTLRLLTFGIFAPLFIERFNCDLVVSFDRLVKQDLFRSGGGPHKTFIDKMQQHVGWWRIISYKVSPYHRLALAIERRQLSSLGSRTIVAVCEQTKRELPALRFNLYALGYNVDKLSDFAQARHSPVCFVPPIELEEMPREYKKHRWLVYTAAKNGNVGWPMAIAEAQASGVGVCVANIRPDLRDYAGPSAFYYDSLDDALKMICQPFPDELRQLGFEQAKKSDISQHRSLLFQLWQMPPRLN